MTISKRPATTSINIFCLAFVAVMVSVYGVLRMGFADNSLLDLLSTAGLTIWMLLLPDFFARLSWLREDNISVTLVTLDVWFSLLLLSFVPFVGWVFPYICVVMAVLLLLDFLRQLLGKGKLAALIVGLLTAIYFAAALWGGKCHNPLYFEKIALGEAHIDLMYHAGISNLMNTHGFATTGLDGNVYLPYHWASHFVAGRFSDLLHIAPVKFYNFSLFVIFLPLLFKSLFLMVMDVRLFHHSTSDTLEKYKRIGSGDFVAVFFIFVLFIPLIMRVSGALYGESTLMAAILSMLIFSLWFKYLYRKRWAEIIVISILTGVLALFKISFGFILVGVYAWLFLRRSWYKSLPRCLLFTTSLAMFVLIYKYNHETGGSANAGFSPRHTLRTVMDLFYPKTWLYYSLCLIPFLFLIIKKIKIKYKLFSSETDTRTDDFPESSYGTGSRRKIPNDLTAKVVSTSHRGNTLIAELLIIIPIIGFVPIALINLKHNSVYFTGYQVYFGAVMTVALLPEMWSVFRKLPLFSTQNLAHTTQSLIFSSILKIVISIALITVVCLGAKVYLRQIPVPIQQNLTIRKTLLQTDDLTPINNKTLIYQAQKNIMTDPPYQWIQQLQALNNKPRSFKRKACLWIPPTNRLYWDMQHYREYGAPFVATSLSGISLINGRPTNDFSRYSYYQYHKDETYDANINTIKQKAIEKGFSILIEMPEVGTPKIHKLLE